MQKEDSMFRKTASIFAVMIAACGAFAVNAAGFDGMALTTNDWFDASFTSLTVDTVIAQDSTTGITLGAGSWTAVPSTGTAKIVADEDAGSGATMLALDAPGEELTFTPAVLVSATGMETLSFDVCTEAVDELLTPDAQTQAAFTIYSDDGVTYALKGYVAGGWTNLEYTAGADTLTNVWLTLYLDFATVSSVRYVRFSVKPAAAASATVLTDSEGTAWFPAAIPAATTVNSVSVTGTGSFRSFSGDSLEEAAVGAASYNGVSYATLSEAIAAAVADSWANGNVTLRADATWKPTSTGTYYIDASGYDLTIVDATCSFSGTTCTVDALNYYWVGGGADNNWTTPANWGLSSGYPGQSGATVTFTYGVEVVVSGAISNIKGINLAESTVVKFSRPLEASSNGSISGMCFVGGESIIGDKIILDGVNLESCPISAGSSTNWFVDIEISANTAVTNTIYCRNADKGSDVSHLDLYGNITGAGNLQLARSGHTSSGVYDGRGGVSLFGNNEAFAGLCIIRSGSSTRGPATFCSSTSGSALARWIYPDAVDANTSARAGTIAVSGSTIKLGSYEGNSYILGCAYRTGNTIEIGGRDIDFTCSLSARSSTAERANNSARLRKVGLGTMTFGDVIGNPCFNTYEMAGGVLKFANRLITRSATGQTSYINPTFTFTGGAVAFDSCCTNATDESLLDISAYVKNSTSAISINLEDAQTLTWATALASSNTGGLVKKGEGTIVLSAAPLYTGDTYLDGGTLKIPTSANKTVKTHVVGKSVRTGTETIGEVEYTVYTLGTKRPTLFIVY